MKNNTMNKEAQDREVMIETINRYLRRISYKQMRTVLFLLWELVKHTDAEVAV